MEGGGVGWERGGTELSYLGDTCFRYAVIKVWAGRGGAGRAGRGWGWGWGRGWGWHWSWGWAFAKKGAVVGEGRECGRGERGEVGEGLGRHMGGAWGGSVHCRAWWQQGARHATLCRMTTQSFQQFWLVPSSGNFRLIHSRSSSLSLCCFQDKAASTISTPVCGGRARTSHVYTSKKNSVEIHIVSPEVFGKRGMFMFHWEGA